MTHLHSTMFLLKLVTFCITTLSPTLFTFHNVSIKTRHAFCVDLRTVNHLHSTMFLLKRLYRLSSGGSERNLHSTMFLLKPKTRRRRKTRSVRFTFHNVSIKTGVAILSTSDSLHLHSTMFLLKPLDDIKKALNVTLFTFHNVSIKTLLALTTSNVSVLIYIPQCFY